MTPLQISMTLNIGSLIFGACAWLLAILALAASKVTASHRNTVLSFSFCTVSLVLQLFEIQNRVNIGDYAAIEDTIRAVLIASVGLTLVTAALNLAALVKRRRK